MAENQAKMYLTEIAENKLQMLRIVAMQLMFMIFVYFKVSPFLGILLGCMAFFICSNYPMVTNPASMIFYAASSAIAFIAANVIIMLFNEPVILFFISIAGVANGLPFPKKNTFSTSAICCAIIYLFLDLIH
ncbi:MAG: hypothetical protein Hyperionvirus1_66 [Hyperionvirus sp.]|uniref:Uncharacterized protein n=1 Tax=Hyperionvirus sp. TaxID=2487770 RepID=A0A3G5A5H8_9VIRU|nr:MAG: hypothetical protein Hyperionvirus1_66 [Hyperionvirus sp.]